MNLQTFTTTDFIVSEYCTNLSCIHKHLEQSGHGMHSIENPKRKSNIHNGGPHAELVEFDFSVVVKVWSSTECRHDPELEEEKWLSIC